jgi:uncharacterized protein YdeI (YjbR/CyaY-like superfamily)
LIVEPKYFGSAAAWRRWLSANHDKEKEAVLLFYKRRLRRGMSYEEALLEALSWGWIDGRLNRIDDEKHVIRFSPRRTGSVWSDANKLRVKKLINAGRMTPAGEAVLPSSLEPEGRSFSVPADLSLAMEKNQKAKAFFDSLTNNQKWMYVGWLTGAKMQETRSRRLSELVRRLCDRKKPGDP